MKSKSSKPVSKVNKIDFTPIPNVQPQINSVPQMTNIQVAQSQSNVNKPQVPQMQVPQMTNIQVAQSQSILNKPQVQQMQAPQMQMQMPIQVQVQAQNRNVRGGVYGSRRSV